MTAEQRTAQRITGAIDAAIQLTSDYGQEKQVLLLPVVVAELLRAETIGSLHEPARGEPRRTGALRSRLESLTQLQQIVWLAVDQLEQRGVDAITADDIRAAYEAERVPVPGNLAEVLARCVRKKWLTDAPNRDGRRAWRVTQLGRSHLKKTGEI